LALLKLAFSNLKPLKSNPWKSALLKSAPGPMKIAFESKLTSDIPVSGL
jgi:hypothetical protein